MKYNEAINKLTSQGKFYINLGLERVFEALDLIGNPHKDLKCIHVAGTNGKGSVCAMIAAVLSEAGFKTGLYTSPHIFDYTERIQINGEQIPKEIFAEKINKLCNLPVHLTEFEILTCAAFKYFKEQNVDFAVIETGLGGRLDATNVIEKPVCSVITHIDFDHTERLGNTIEKIAAEKAGIIKNGCPVIINENNSGLEIIKSKCSPIVVGKCENPTLSLKGTCQSENLALALEALKIAAPDLSSDVIAEGLKKVKHPCRFEYIQEKNLIVDGCHNPNGASALRESLDKYFPETPKRFVFGCLKNKDYKKMMEILFKENDEIYFYHFKSPNSASFEELSAVCPYPSQKIENYTHSERLTVICGSFYMLGEILP